MLKGMIFANIVSFGQKIVIVMFPSKMKTMWCLSLLEACACRNDVEFTQRQSLTANAPTHRLASLPPGQVGDQLDRAWYMGFLKETLASCHGLFYDLFYHRALDFRRILISVRVTGPNAPR